MYESIFIANTAGKHVFNEAKESNSAAAQEAVYI